MICANNTARSSRSDEEAHDHIGSISTTPSGVATPNPNPTDKRLPGIVHSYFGQVCARFFKSSSHQNYHLFAISSACMSIWKYKSQRLLKILRVPPPAFICTCQQSNTEKCHVSMFPPHVALVVSNFEIRNNNLLFWQYPTPPISSPSSLLEKDTTDTFEAGVIFWGLHENSEDNLPWREAGSCNGTLSENIKHQSGNEVIPLGTHIKKGGLDPLPNIITYPPLAAHFSNPISLYLSTTPAIDTCDSQLNSARSSLTLFLELIKLTKGVAALPRSKNTPPLTPRALSNDDIETTKKPSLPTANEPLVETRDISLRNDKSDIDVSSISAIPKTSAPVGPPRGKLWVKILEARGLRPSYDPYVVCVFEWNESIARRAKSGEMDVDKDDGKGKEDLLRGVPVKRIVSDMGRSMAIPMKSRQGSTASLSDYKTFKNGRQLTDPKWEHEAVLYAKPFKH